ncbi:MAG: hypothetical protein Q27BPR15_07120 [Rhodobacter sp. CACIA14H1]|nr:MAG: hypothetical protein Q27BPR15_07120 [Rhodobacter sp. CACIA14H1]
MRMPANIFLVFKNNITQNSHATIAMCSFMDSAV